MPYEVNSQVSAFRVDTYYDKEKAPAFAEALCVGPANYTKGTNVNMNDAGAAGLFDLYDGELIYSKNIHERMHPASLTKIMTALVAIKYGNMDDLITFTEDMRVTESGAQLCGLKVGDTFTLNQALHALLINSANDAAMAIAFHIAGSEEAFAEMMNKQAKSIGATNSHFVNAHGLTAEEHYVTAYDIYLIFNEAIQFSAFNEIIQMDSYTSIYHDAEGAEKELSFNTTNLFLKGDYESPDKVTIIGGKTGTTNAAKNCLVILSKDSSGRSYISVILAAKERGILYNEMIDLLEEIAK